MYSWSLIDYCSCLLLIPSSQNVDLTHLPFYLELGVTVSRG